MPKKYLLLFICLFCTACFNRARINLVSVYDGDTFKVNLPCKEKILCKNILIRIKGIDTPEIKTKNIREKEKALAAKLFTEKLLFNGEIILRNCKRDKYFRLLCDVFIKKEKEEIKLADKLLYSGLAVQYDGKTKSKFE